MKVFRDFFFFKSSLTGAPQVPSQSHQLLFQSHDFLRSILPLHPLHLSSSHFVSPVARYDGSIVGEVEQEFTVLRRKCVFSFDIFAQCHVTACRAGTACSRRTLPAATKSKQAAAPPPSCPHRTNHPPVWLGKRSNFVVKFQRRGRQLQCSYTPDRQLQSNVSAHICR